MRITANDFWRLLPLALKRLDEHLRLDEYRGRQDVVGLQMAIIASPESGRKNPSPGESMRYIIRTPLSSRHFIVDPLTAVLWMLTGTYVLRHQVYARFVGLDPRFAKRVHAAIYHNAGFSRPVRKKLLLACELDLKYLEPTTARTGS